MLEYFSIGPINPLKTNPLTGPAPLGPLKSILMFPKNMFLQI